MSEIGGIGKLWGMITGQAAKEAARQTQLEDQAKRKQEALTAKLAQLQVKAAETELVLRGAISIPISELGQDPTLESEIADIESGVKATEIYSKFYPGVSLKGRIFTDRSISGNDYDGYGDTEEIPLDLRRPFSTDQYLIPTWLIGAVVRVHKEADTKEFQDVRKKHFLMAVAHPNGQDAVVTYQFLHNHHDRSYRPTGVAAISFLLDKDRASQLLGLARANADAAEMFLQRGAAGFESSNPHRKPGIARIRSNKLVLIDFTKFDPMTFNMYYDKNRGVIPEPTNGRLLYDQSPIIKKALTDNTEQAHHLSYSKPFGVVNPQQIP